MRWVLVVGYVVGVAGMLAFTLSCYPGTLVGKIGWALTWPISGPGLIIEYGLQLDKAVVSASCPAFIQESAKGILTR